MDHYVTAIAMDGEAAVVACRCGWLKTITSEVAWREHLKEGSLSD